MSDRRPARLFLAALFLLLAWGAFAFGAEYAWAYAPLLIWAAVTGLLGWIASPADRLPARAFFAALSVVFLAVLLQLAPAPRPLVARVSPARVAVDYDALHAAATMQGPDGDRAPRARVPLSIAPSRTALGLAFLGALTILLAGCTRGFAATGVRPVARGILLLGVAAALTGIVQKASGSELVYGFWHQRQPQGVFAPFNNRNHFAGWAVMGLALGAGYLGGCLARALRGVRPDWRHRLLWFSTPAASETLLAGLGLAVMAAAVVLSASRSGVLCLMFVLALFIGLVLRRQATRSRRAIGVAYVIVLLVLAAIWGGVDAVLQRFRQFEPSMEGRFAVWRETLAIVRDFPLTGTGLNTYGIAMLHYQQGGVAAAVRSLAATARARGSATAAPGFAA
ncbi:MAG TPA: O-antigen ligase family protein, partial [Vicinamibacterales bacterium]|nr:O-antigen ligase family protein [Vicinamibacterales bacterium]